jgi:citrate lyase subunit beta/citryl-CoA lyase
MIMKAFSFQDEKGPVFDITQDCEDGAPTAKRKTTPK